MSLPKNLGVPAFQTSRTQAVADALRQAILDGTLVAGERLNLDELSEHFSVSRMPVREAISQLETEGLVNVYPYRGVEVSSLALDDLDELFGLRELLEQKAVERAVERLSDTDLAEMRRVLEAMDSLAEEDDAWIDLNREFHRIINTACDWPRMVEMIDVLRNNVDRYVRAYLSILGRKKPQAQHWALYQACVERNADRARAMIAEHLRDTADALKQQFDEQKAQPEAARQPENSRRLPKRRRAIKSR